MPLNYINLQSIYMGCNLDVSNNLITTKSIVVGQYYPNLNCILWNTSSYAESLTQSISLEYDFSIH